MSDQPPMNQQSPRTLAALRLLIDEVDEELVLLLARRARLVVEVGQAKRAESVPVYAPNRERAVIGTRQVAVHDAHRPSRFRCHGPISLCVIDLRTLWTPTTSLPIPAPSASSNATACSPACSANKLGGSIACKR